MTTSVEERATNRVACGLLLDALDVLLFRRARPFGRAGHAESMRAPFPQTVFGAVTTALLRAFGCPFDQLHRILQKDGATLEEALDELGVPTDLARVSIRGPWLAITPRGAADSSELELVFPPPADLRRGKERDRELVKLRPWKDVEFPGWPSTFSAAHGLMPLWHTSQQRLKPLDRWLSGKAVAAYLSGELPDWNDLLEPSSLWAFDHRTGIGIESASQTADDGLIYAASFLSLAPDVASEYRTSFYLEVAWPQSFPASSWPADIRMIALGGEKRYAAVEPLSSPFDWRRLEPAAPELAKILLTTPALLANPLKPLVVQDEVVAAAVGQHEPVSGWDLGVGGPKPSRHAVGAGTVWYLENQPTEWPRAICESPADGQQGWGSYLRGVW